MTTYVLHPGPVRSRHDGDVHHIPARELARLYGVPPTSCAVHRDPLPGCHAKVWPPGTVHLYPSSSGNYTLPKV